MLSQPPMQVPVMGGMPMTPAAPMQAPAGASSAAPHLLPYASQVQPVGYRPMYYYGAAPYYWNSAR